MRISLPGSGGDVTHGRGDVLGQGDLRDAGVQQAGGFGADPGHGTVARNPLVAGLVIPIGDVGGHFAEMVHGAIEDDFGHGADGAVVEEDFVARQGKLVADAVPVRGVVRARQDARAAATLRARQEGRGQGGEEVTAKSHEWECTRSAGGLCV
jgi:hypothetical protein